eukprot:2839134-Amphidinium_carterae.1
MTSQCKHGGPTMKNPKEIVGILTFWVGFAVLWTSMGVLTSEYFGVPPSSHRPDRQRPQAHSRRVFPSQKRPEAIR